MSLAMGGLARHDMAWVVHNQVDVDLGCVVLVPKTLKWVWDGCQGCI